MSDWTPFDYDRPVVWNGVTRALKIALRTWDHRSHSSCPMCDRDIGDRSRFAIGGYLICLPCVHRATEAEEAIESADRAADAVLATDA